MIKLATTPTEIAAVKALFVEYLAFVEGFLDHSLAFQGTQSELSDFPMIYDALFLAVHDGKPVGACGLKPFTPSAGELKRLWVRPEARGRGYGLRLTQAAIAGARKEGYNRLLLDTNPGLTHANAVYEALGFADIAPYYDNPLGESSRYMGLGL